MKPQQDNYNDRGISEYDNKQARLEILLVEAFIPVFLSRQCGYSRGSRNHVEHTHTLAVSQINQVIRQC